MANETKFQLGWIFFLCSRNWGSNFQNILDANLVWQHNTYRASSINKAFNLSNNDLYEVFTNYCKQTGSSIPSHIVRHHAYTKQIFAQWAFNSYRLHCMWFSEVYHINVDLTVHLTLSFPLFLAQMLKAQMNKQTTNKPTSHICVIAQEFSFS